MKISGKAVFFATLVLATVLAAPPGLMALTGASGQRPEDAEPPYGLKIEGDAKGTKLNGSIMVEYYSIDKAFQKVEPLPIFPPPNCRGVVVDGQCCGGDADLTSQARVVLRLRQGSVDQNLYTYFADIGEVPLSGDPADVQMAIQSNLGLKEAILRDFLGITDASTVAAMTVVLRNISEFGVVDGDVETDLTGDPSSCDVYDIDYPDETLQCTESCGGSRFLLADVVITVR